MSKCLLVTIAGILLNFIYVGGQRRVEVKFFLVIVVSQRDIGLEVEFECRAELDRGPEGIK